MEGKNAFTGLGVANIGKRILLFGSGKKSKKNFAINESRDGFDFEPFKKKLVLKSKTGEDIKVAEIKEWRPAFFAEHYFLTYLRNKNLKLAYSDDLTHWGEVGKIKGISKLGMLVPSYKHNDKVVLYYGEKELKVAYSKDFVNWEKAEKPILGLDPKLQDKRVIKIGNIIPLSGGNLIIFFLYNPENNSNYSLELVLVDKNNPEKIIWEKGSSLWKQPQSWEEKEVSPIGVIGHKNQIFSYWQIKGEGIFAENHFYPRPEFKEEVKFSSPIPLLNKFKNNPLLGPIKENFWESQAVFNPAAVKLDDEVHILYRAVGDDGRSVLGYASSEDGVKIKKRLNEPVYYPRKKFEGAHMGAPQGYTPYASGGGWGGCEDPRLTRLEGRIYLTYVAYSGYSHPRVAMSSIDENDFRNQNWNWEDPVLISKPGVVDKNSCILPKKVNGKYVIFHRIYPNILIDYVDDLDFDGETKFLQGKYKIEPRKERWDSRKVGVGPTPIETDEGWLVIYHAVADKGCYDYKMGAMLLDKDDPKKVLYRTNSPILEPQCWYENQGFKAGVAYPCGAVEKDGKLLVYYGGADTVTCGAEAKMDQFLNELKTSGTANLKIV